MNYVRPERLPVGGDWSPITNALRQGAFFWTSGEVLLPDVRLTRSGDDVVVEADVHWTFPLDFVEVVWGDGDRTGREIVRATDQSPVANRRFRVPVPSAGNGAQPVKLR